MFGMFSLFSLESKSGFSVYKESVSDSAANSSAYISVFVLLLLIKGNNHDNKLYLSRVAFASATNSAGPESSAFLTPFFSY